MSSVKTLFLTLLIACISLDALSQLVWNEMSVSQLPELSSMRLTSMDADDSGVWIASEDGLIYWRAETQEFERINAYLNIPIKEVIYSNGFVFVLTKTGDMSRLDYAL